MKRFFSWLASKFSPRQASPRTDLKQTGAHLRQTGQHAAPKKAKIKQAVPRQQPEYVDLDDSFEDRIETNGPGKNVLIRNKYVREDTGTHETLTILDDSAIDTDEEEGIDPYNTGQFDRSKNWDKRFRKD